MIQLIMIKILERTLMSQNSLASIYKIKSPKGIFLLKECNQKHMLITEAMMLKYLKKNHLNVPEIIKLEKYKLYTEFHENNGQINKRVEEEIAINLSSVHNISNDYYGFEKDTIIGPYQQFNKRYTSWIDFFTEQRILNFAILAFEEGTMPLEYLRRIEKFIVGVRKFLYEPEKPSLLHGDIWKGNIIVSNGKVYYINPAIYFGHNEIELAFILMFNTLGDHFFNAYNEIKPIEDGFFEERASIYNLYPYLVHVRSFGDSYLSSTDKLLKSFGY